MDEAARQPPAEKVQKLMALDRCGNQIGPSDEIAAARTQPRK
jgi:hypothetical protein